MSNVIQKMKFDPSSVESDEFRIRIPRKGEIKPSKVKTDFSGIPQVEQILIFTATNYEPGVIKFSKSR